MKFPNNLYFVAFVSAFATTLFSVPIFRRWSYRIGLVDDPGHRKIHDQPIALAGGVAVLAGLLFPMCFGVLVLYALPSVPDADLVSRPILTSLRVGTNAAKLLSHGFERRAIELSAILLGTVAMGILGWLDDKHDLTPSLKFGGQLLVAALAALAGVRITLFVPNQLFSFSITILWIVTVTNAFNFMDNMNGLCAGLGVIGSWYFALSAAAQGQYLVALMALLACGALCGFLPYNFPKATIFLGDTGSHLIGYLMAVLAILPHFYTRQNPHPWAVISPLLILAIPLMDLVCVVSIRWRSGNAFYIGDNNHFSHRLVRRGWNRTQAVMLIWLLAAALGALSFL